MDSMEQICGSNKLDPFSPKKTRLDRSKGLRTTCRLSLETVDSHEECLNEVKISYDVTRKQAKDLFIRMAFGGYYKKWA